MYYTIIRLIDSRRTSIHIITETATELFHQPVAKYCRLETAKRYHYEGNFHVVCTIIACDLI